MNKVTVFPGNNYKDADTVAKANKVEEQHQSLIPHTKSLN